MLVIKQIKAYSLMALFCTLLPISVIAKSKLQPIEFRAQIGYSDFDVDSANLVSAGGCSTNPLACPTSQTSDNQDTAYSFLLTYNAWQNRYFNVAVEGGYTNYGQAEYHAFYAGGEPGKRTVDSMAWNASLKGQYLLTPWFQPYIKFGAAHVKTNINQNGLKNVESPNFDSAVNSNHTSNDTVPQLDLGIDFRFFSNYVTGYINYTWLFGPGDTVNMSSGDEYLPLPTNTPEIGVIFAGIAVGFDPFKWADRG